MSHVLQGHLLSVNLLVFLKRNYCHELLDSQGHSSLYAKTQLRTHWKISQKRKACFLQWNKSFKVWI